MTDVERFVWARLRSRRFHAFKFRRQVSIGPYIVDFVCFDRLLIIELDGGQHNENGQKLYDQRRTAFLESQGCCVLRFWNFQITDEWEDVEESIWNSLQ